MSSPMAMNDPVNCAVCDLGEYGVVGGLLQGVVSISTGTELLHFVGSMGNMTRLFIQLGELL